MKQWDVFISHASEDSQAVAEPLADHLKRLGLDVWLDGSELTLGDSLSEKIDEGLANSFFGVLIVSPSFMAKQWPRRELNALLAKEEQGHKVILPVWHTVDRHQLLAYSPILADRLASNTAKGLAKVARDIADVVLDPKNSSMPAERRGVGSRFLLLLNSKADREDVKSFLRQSEPLSRAAFELPRWDPQTALRWDVTLGPHHIDLAVGTFSMTMDAWRWKLVTFLPPRRGPSLESFKAGIGEAVGAFTELRGWISRYRDTPPGELADLTEHFEALLFVGRRADVGSAERDSMGAFGRQLGRGSVRTYDSLVDNALKRDT